MHLRLFICVYQMGHLVLEVQLGLFDCLSRVGSHPRSVKQPSPFSFLPGSD